MSLLLDLTLRGSAATLVVLVFDRLLAPSTKGSSRRWWWCFVPVAFLVPFRLPLVPAPSHVPAIATALGQALMGIPGEAGEVGGPAIGHPNIAACLWLAGAIAYLALVLVQTARASRRWSRERLSTDHGLLELLEDCKAETGVTAPIGLVISNSVPSPAIMGWLRPRILIPAPLAASAAPGEIRPILLHELAHFRWYDVPFSWLLTIVRAIHWFNPLSHAAAAAWARFREEAADETAMGWMRDSSGQAYGEALVLSLRRTHGGPVPFGSLAIVESVSHLKQRITMINRYPNKAPRILVAAVVSLILATMALSRFARASDEPSSGQKEAIVAGMLAWTGEIDSGGYAQSWKDASAFFQSKLDSDKWVEMLTNVRTPLGKCSGRREVSLAIEKDPDPKGIVKGTFAIAQFESSYDNLKHAVDTVTFMREKDGAWKAAGYYIRP